MNKITFVLVLLVIKISLPYNDPETSSAILAPVDSTGPATKAGTQSNVIVPHNNSFLFSNSRAFGFDAFLGTFGPCKWYLNSPETITSISMQSGDFFAGGSWANGKWYAITYTSHDLLICDTTSGSNTVVGNLGSISGNTVALCWDPTSSTMYMLTNNPTNLYQVNINSGLATLVAPVTGVGGLIDGAVSNDGILYGIEYNGFGDLGIINKSTGVWATVGPLGIIPIHAQGSAFDRSTNTYYWAAYTLFGLSTLRTINLATGVSTIIGSFQYNAEIDGFVIPYSTYVQQAHEMAVGPFLSFPTLFLVNTPYNIRTQVRNVGSSNETNVPIRWYVNGTLTNTTNINLNSGQVDSVSNIWTPASAGTYVLKYISGLTTDTIRVDDTVQSTVTVYTTIPSLCEGFNSITFPPPGWSVSGGGQEFWYRRSESGFGLGTGSAYYDMWNGPANNNGALYTINFAPTGPSDTLFFDIAFCQYQNVQDSLLILTSINGGATYTVLVRMGPSDMATVSSCSHPFTPTSSQWGTKRFLLPAGTNKLDFIGLSQYGDGVFLDSICIKQGYVGIQNLENIPKVFSLSQNYPNPFNPNTIIKYQIAKNSFVKLTIYDVLGREISILVNQQLKPGNYEASWNASEYPSGVYFYKLEAGDFVSTKKMVLVK